MANGEFAEILGTLRSEIPFVVSYRGEIGSDSAVLTKLEPPLLQFEVPIKRRAYGFDVELNVSQPGAYTLSYEGNKLSFTVAARRELSLLDELGLTTLLVFLTMGVAVLWARRKRGPGKPGAGFFSQSGLF